MPRQSNFELLRLLAMLGVVIGHVYNYGLHIYEGDGVDYLIAADSVGGMSLWSVLQLGKLLSLVSVDCYVLLTGYFLLGNRQLRLRGFLRVWATAWIYSVGLYLLLAAVGQTSWQWSRLLHYATPLCSNVYWFVTNYLLLLLVAPLLSWAADWLGRRGMTSLLVLGFVCVFQPMLGRYTMVGQQMLLFVYLFLVGGYVRRYGLGGSLSRRWLILAFVLLLGLMLAVSLYKSHAANAAAWAIQGMANNGLVLPLSVVTFLLFSRLSVPIRYQRVVCALAPLSFAVYLIHEHPCIHAWMWPRLTALLSGVNPWLHPLLVLVVSLGVFLVGIVVDGVRRWLSQKLLPGGMFSDVVRCRIAR